MHWYTIGFWRKTEQSGIPFDEIARRAYDTITIFNDLQEEYRPNYQTVRRKRDAVPFDWGYDNFYEKLKKMLTNPKKLYLKS